MKTVEIEGVGRIDLDKISYVGFLCHEGVFTVVIDGAAVELLGLGAHDRLLKLWGERNAND